LDEYEENRQVGYRDFVELLTCWAGRESQGLKICVSSREYSAFSSISPHNQKLRLQDLTKDDIRSCISDKFEGYRVLEGKGRLMTSITDRANGVFLWVALVTSSICDQLDNGFSVSTVELGLEDIPDELDKLFSHLFFKNCAISRRKTACRTLSMVLTANNHRLRSRSRPLITLDMYYFVDEYEKNPRFALEQSSRQLSRLEPNMDLRKEAARKKLFWYCSGLIEPVSQHGLDFTHRSVPEFLESENVKPTMDQYLKDFSPQDAISQLFLATVKANKTCSVEDLSNDLHNIMRLRIAAGIDRKTFFAFWECFHLEFLRRGMKEWPPEDVTKIGFLDHWFAHIKKPRRSTSLGSADFLSMSEINPQHSLEKRFHVFSPFLQSAYLGHGEYLRWKVLSDPLILNTKEKCGFLMSFIALGHRLGAICVVEHLIDRLHPQTIIHSGWANLFEPEPSSKEGLTFWQGFIRSIHFAGKAQSKLWDRNLVGQLIQLFLVKGADTRLSIAIMDTVLSPRQRAWKGSMMVERMSVAFEGTDGSEDLRDAQAFCSVTFGEEHSGVWKAPEQLREFIETRGGRISLRDLVDYWMPDNRDTIFAMLERLENGVYKSESSPRQESPGVTNSSAIARRNGSKTWLEIAQNAAIILLGKRLTSLVCSPILIQI
jgi:hypothetical protein